MSERREQQIFIHAPGLRGPHRRAGDQLLTLLMWGIYAYLWLPFISLVAWYLGYDLFYQEMVVEGGFQAFLDLAIWYLLVILLILLIVAAWSSSNYFRFRGKQRRGPQPEVTDDEMAQWFGIEPDQVETLRGRGRMTLAFEDDGSIAEISPS